MLPRVSTCTHAECARLRHRMGMDEKGARFLRNFFLGLFIGEIASWVAVVVLMVLSLVWLRDPVMKIILGAWVIAAVVSVARAWPRNAAHGGPSKAALLFMAPFHPFFRVFIARRFRRDAQSRQT